MKILYLLLLLPNIVLGEWSLGYFHMEHFDDDFNVEGYPNQQYNKSSLVLMYSNSDNFKIGILENSYKGTRAEVNNGLSLFATKNISIYTYKKFNLGGEIGAIIYGYGYKDLTPPANFILGITTKYKIVNNVSIESIVTPRFVLLGLRVSIFK